MRFYRVELAVDGFFVILNKLVLTSQNKQSWIAPDKGNYWFFGLIGKTTHRNTRKWNQVPACLNHKIRIPVAPIITQLIYTHLTPWLGIFSLEPSLSYYLNRGTTRQSRILVNGSIHLDNDDLMVVSWSDRCGLDVYLTNATTVYCQQTEKPSLSLTRIINTLRTRGNITKWD